MKSIEGDLLELARRKTFDVVVHGCNCYHRMDAGIARQVHIEYPGAYEADCETPLGDVSKLGTLSHYATGDGFIIVNAYTQHGYGWGRKHLNENALWNCFLRIKNIYAGMKIGYPLIGAGLARGDWNVIAPLIDKALEGEDHTLVVFKERNGA